MKKMFLYLKYYLGAETKALRKEAFDAAKRYYAAKPLRTNEHPYPHPIEYSRRREDFQAFQRGYINARCSEIAKTKLANHYK